MKSLCNILGIVRFMEETVPRPRVNDPVFELGTSPEKVEIIAKAVGDKVIDNAMDLLKEMLEPLPG
jgi:hypothetical protein